MLSYYVKANKWRAKAIFLTSKIGLLWNFREECSKSLGWIYCILVPSKGKILNWIEINWSIWSFQSNQDHWSNITPYLPHESKILILIYNWGKSDCILSHCSIQQSIYRLERWSIFYYWNTFYQGNWLPKHHYK